MVDGTAFWISCQWLTLLRILSDSKFSVIYHHVASIPIVSVLNAQPVDAKLKSLTSRTMTNWKLICWNGYTVAWRNLRLLYQGHVNNWVYHHLSVRMGLHSFVHIYSICLENKIDLYVWNLVQRLQIFSQLWICQTQDIKCRERWLIEYLLIFSFLIINPLTGP